MIVVENRGHMGSTEAEQRILLLLRVQTAPGSMVRWICLSLRTGSGLEMLSPF